MTQDPLAASEVFYDGACPVCRREIAVYRGLPALSDVRWTDVSDPETRLTGLDRETALRRIHIRRRDGRLASGAEAFTAIWRNHPRLRPLARLLDVPPLSTMAELGYRAFLRVRRLWRRPA
ncbi:MAG: DUF393 domain-containing protein [Pseudomonadota bacterium]